MGKIYVVDANNKCGWVLQSQRGYLHKDFTWHSSTGYCSNNKAPGYYPTKAIAQAYLDEYLSRNQIKEEQKMKKGDKVMIENSSYSMTIVDGKLEHKSYEPIRNSCKSIWIVLEINCRFPKTSSWYDDNYNNTVIQNIVDKTIMFIERRFLKLATRTIELSEQSFQNLKKQLN